MCELMGASVSLCDPTQCMGRAGGTLGLVALKLCVLLNMNPWPRSMLHSGIKPKGHRQQLLWHGVGHGKREPGFGPVQINDICTNACLAAFSCKESLRAAGVRV